MMYTEPCVDDKYFINRKWTKESEGVFTKKEYAKVPNFTTQQFELLERTVRFKVYQVNPEYGTEIWWYYGPYLQMSGYWTDRADFEKTFKL